MPREIVRAPSAATPPATASPAATSAPPPAAPSPATANLVQPASAAVSFDGSATKRLLDTRSDAGGKAKLDDAAKRLVIGTKDPTTGRVIEAVAINITVTEAETAGYVTAYPAATKRPVVSNLNYAAGSLVSNQAVVPLGSGGAIDVYAFRTAHVIVDQTGVFLRGGQFQAVTPTRLHDSRLKKTPIARGGTIDIAVGGTAGVPASGVAAVVLNVTATASDGPGYFTAYAADAARPDTSNLNYATGQDVAAMVVTPVSAAGVARVYSMTRGHVVVDVAGYFTTGGDFVFAPRRVTDSRVGVGMTRALWAHHSGDVDVLAGSGRSPGTVRAVLVNITTPGAQDSGFITAYGADAARGNTSTVNYAAGQAVANTAFVDVSGAGTIAVYTMTETDVVVDVVGYVLGAPTSVSSGTLTDATIGAVSVPRDNGQTDLVKNLGQVDRYSAWSCQYNDSERTDLTWADLTVSGIRRDPDGPFVVDYWELFGNRLPAGLGLGAEPMIGATAAEVVARYPGAAVQRDAAREARLGRYTITWPGKRYVWEVYAPTGRVAFLRAGDLTC